MEFVDDGYGSFGGLVYQDISNNEADVIVIGIPYDGATSGARGTATAPNELRLHSTDLQTMSRTGINLDSMVIQDMGNVRIHPLNYEKTRDIIEATYTKLFASTRTPIITIGGDHSCSYPIIKALVKKGKVAILWFDAHRDVLDELAGSRFSHGSPLRRVIELDDVNPQNVLLIGTRYMEPTEQQFVEEHGIAELRMVDLEEHNFNKQLFQTKIEEIQQNTEYLYVSIDIDILDPAFAPGTGTPVGGGMSTSQLMRLISLIPGRIDAVDVMEVSPPLDPTQTTIKTTLGVVTEILARLKVQ